VTNARRALVVSLSPLATDPRILREIEWLASDGWTVDSLGIGSIPDPRVQRHFATRTAPRWTRPRLVKGLLFSLVPYALRYRILTESLIPRDLRAASRRYDLIVANDVDFVPWLVAGGRALRAAHGRVHLDLHEWHGEQPGRPSGVIARLVRNFDRWKAASLTSEVFTSRSTVSPGLGEMYARQYGIQPPTIVRSLPGYEDLVPSPVDADSIDLVYHGIPDLSRGLGLFAEALPLLEPRFHLHLMLMGSAADQAPLRALLTSHADRVSFHDPVPVTEIARRINEWDVEVMFFPPIRPNLVFTLPNKFFEAVQGRLGVVIGESPDMVRLAQAGGFGKVIEGWTAVDLAEGLNSLTRDDIAAMKESTRNAARDLNAENEGRVFLATIETPVS